MYFSIKELNDKELFVLATSIFCSILITLGIFITLDASVINVYCFTLKSPNAGKTSLIYFKNVSFGPIIATESLERFILV